MNSNNNWMSISRLYNPGAIFYVKEIQQYPYINHNFNPIQIRGSFCNPFNKALCDLVIPYGCFQNYGSCYRVIIEFGLIVNNGHISCLHLGRGHLRNEGTIDKIYIKQDEFGSIDNRGVINYIYVLPGNSNWRPLRPLINFIPSRSASNFNRTLRPLNRASTTSNRSNASLQPSPKPDQSSACEPRETTEDPETDSDSDIEVLPDRVEIVDLCTPGPSSSKNTQRENRQVNKVSYKGPICPICKRPARDHDPVSTECGHIYCKKCLEESLKLRPAKKCPMCKKHLSKKKPFRKLLL